MNFEYFHCKGYVKRLQMLSFTPLWINKLNTAITWYRLKQSFKNIEVNFRVFNNFTLIVPLVRPLSFTGCMEEVFGGRKAYRRCYYNYGFYLSLCRSVINVKLFLLPHSLSLERFNFYYNFLSKKHIDKICTFYCIVCMLLWGRKAFYVLCDYTSDFQHAMGMAPSNWDHSGKVTLRHFHDACVWICWCWVDLWTLNALFGPIEADNHTLPYFWSSMQEKHNPWWLQSYNSRSPKVTIHSTIFGRMLNPQGPFLQTQTQAWTVLPPWEHYFCDIDSLFLVEASLPSNKPHYMSECAWTHFCWNHSAATQVMLG